MLAGGETVGGLVDEGGFVDVEVDRQRLAASDAGEIGLVGRTGSSPVPGWLGHPCPAGHLCRAGHPARLVTRAGRARAGLVAGHRQ